ncbi:MAG: methyltransferase domain-containing protein [Bacteroidota bacterium]
MKAETAQGLIAALDLRDGKVQRWIDLGAGQGTFTEALAHFLPAESEILAIDQSHTSLQKIKPAIGTVQIRKQQGDFFEPPKGLSSIDGLLMANAFHYVKDKAAFIRMWEEVLAEEASFLIIEYDTQRSNDWVPYPIRPKALQELFYTMGYTSFKKLGETPSLYHNMIYAAQVRK